MSIHKTNDVRHIFIEICESFIIPVAAVLSLFLHADSLRQINWLWFLSDKDNLVKNTFAVSILMIHYHDSSNFKFRRKLKSIPRKAADTVFPIT
jgi:hypothetical protein